VSASILGGHKPVDARLLDGIPDPNPNPDPLPVWLTPADLD
jgi:hypothetical protein